MEISIFPEEFYVCGINVGKSVVISWMVLAVVLVLLVLVRLKIRKFTEKPHGLQNLLELAVEGVYSFAKGKVGEAAEFAAPFAMTFMLYVFSMTFVEIFGISPATEDINCTLALGLCSFVMVNFIGLKFRGLRGRIRGMCNPSAVVMPIKMLTDCIAPFSMAIRLFANVLVGGVVMSLLYSVFPVLLPVPVSAYFNVLHIGIQTFVFGLLFLTYTSEALE